MILVFNIAEKVRAGILRSLFVVTISGQIQWTSNIYPLIIYILLPALPISPPRFFLAPPLPRNKFASPFPGSPPPLPAGATLLLRLPGYTAPLSDCDRTNETARDMNFQPRVNAECSRETSKYLASEREVLGAGEKPKTLFLKWVFRPFFAVGEGGENQELLRAA